MAQVWRKSPQTVKISLGRNNVNPDKPNKHGETPLWWAVLNGHKGAVTLLLGEEDINPGKPNIHGRTPLSPSGGGSGRREQGAIHGELIQMTY